MKYEYQISNIDMINYVLSIRYSIDYKMIINIVEYFRYYIEEIQK